MTTDPVTTTALPAAKNRFRCVKIFSATMAQEREALGDKIGAWLAAHPNIEVVDKIVTQSSDRAFHCLAITLFYNQIK